MLKLIQLLMFLFCSVSCAAEYDSHRVHFEIHLENETITDGYFMYYNAVPEFLTSEDSIQLKNLLFNNQTSSDSLMFLSGLFFYTFPSDLEFEGRNNVIFTRTSTFSKDDIVYIKVKSIKWQSALDGISSSHEAKDTIWMKTDVTRVVSYSPYCDVTLFVHETSSELDKLFSEIEALETQLNNALNNDEANKIEDELRSYQEKLKKFKVVFYSSC